MLALHTKEGVVIYANDFKFDNNPILGKEPNYEKLNEMELELFESLKQILIKYLYSPRITPINIDELTSELKELNKIFKLTSTSTSSRQTSSLKVSTTKGSKGVTGQTYILNSSQKKRSKNSKSKTSKQRI